MHYGAEDMLHALREVWSRALILNRPERPREHIGQDVASGLADLESYGQFTLANPDFVARLTSGAPLNQADKATYFGDHPDNHAAGYTDYPSLVAGSS